MKSRYDNSIYKMYEEVINKNNKLTSDIKYLKLENVLLNRDNKRLNSFNDNIVKNAVEKATKKLINELEILNNKLSEAYEEIDRLKSQIKNNNIKDAYIIDKLTNQVNKNSSNSSIPTSKEMVKKHTGTNTYNHREKSSKKTGGQLGHKGTTLTNDKIEQLIKDNNIKVKEIKHYVKGKKEKVIKYKFGLNVQPYIEKHIFIYCKKYKEKMPKEFYSNVTYSNDIKTIISILGNYCSISYSKIKELLSDLSGGIINISEGTIDNIYEELSRKSKPTIVNIKNNILNGKYQHTDETVTSENGKETYYRGYSNSQNVLYKYHHHKGDNPIKEDDILPKFLGTIISDHETGIFKYGKNNQDCIVHLGRYCIEAYQNVYETSWQMDMYNFLLLQLRKRELLEKFGQSYFNKEDIIKIEREYDKILYKAEIENKEIQSTYWKGKENTLYKRLKKYKKEVLYYIYDFSIPCENNAMERNLRMIKGKTKVSGGFRSSNGGERFGNIMSVIKTSKLRKINTFECIKQIFQGNALFA